MENKCRLDRRREMGGRLRLERQRVGLNQKDFGAVAEVSKTTQVNYESGERAPDADYLADIADLADVLYVLTGKRLEQARLAGLEEEKLLSILKAIEAWECERGERVDVETRVRLIAIFYSHALVHGRLEQDWMRQTMKKMK